MSDQTHAESYSVSFMSPKKIHYARLTAMLYVYWWNPNRTNYNANVARILIYEISRFFPTLSELCVNWEVFYQKHLRFLREFVRNVLRTLEKKWSSVGESSATDRYINKKESHRQSIAYSWFPCSWCLTPVDFLLPFNLKRLTFPATAWWLIKVPRARENGDATG